MFVCVYLYIYLYITYNPAPYKYIELSPPTHLSIYQSISGELV